MAQKILTDENIDEFDKCGCTYRILKREKLEHSCQVVTTMDNYKYINYFSHVRYSNYNNHHCSVHSLSYCNIIIIIKMIIEGLIIIREYLA